MVGDGVGWIGTNNCSQVRRFVPFIGYGGVGVGGIQHNVFGVVGVNIVAQLNIGFLHGN